MIDLEAILQELLIGGAYIEEGRLRVPDSGLSAQKLALLSEYESEILRLLPTYSFEMPLSYGQEALWVVHQNAPNKAAYNTAVVLHLQSAVDKALLRDIFQKIGQRHSALRTTIAVRNGQPKQVIHATQALCFSEVDCSGQSWEMVMQAIEQAHQRLFDLSEGPLWRVTLVSQSPDSQALLLSFHHIVIDGWSVWMLVDEFLALAGAARRTVNLPPITGTYPEFVQWQRETLDTRGDDLRAYWQEALGGNLPVLDLPTDYRRPKVTTSQTNSLPFNLSSDLRDQLRALARREGVSFYTVLLAVLQILLARYSSAERILVGVPTAGREGEAFAQTFGYFVNMVVVDATLTDVPFTTFLQQVRAKLLAAIKHRAYPFPWVVKDLQIERDPSRGPIFQASLVVQRPQKLEEKTLRLLKGEQVQLASDLRLQLRGWLQTTGELDLMFDLMEHTSPEGVVGYIRYRSDLFSERTIERMGQHYQQLLKAVVSDATQGIYQLPLLTDAEYHQIVYEWNDTAVDFGEPQTIHALFEQQVERTPDAIALVFSDEQLTYAELNARANQLAHHLISLGIQPDGLVAVAMERSIEMVISLLAVLKAGGAYVPIDPTYPEERIRYMLTDCAAPILLTQSHLELSHVTSHVIPVDRTQLDRQPTQNPQTQISAYHLAYVIYTSGSTGQPKGVMIQHSQLYNLLRWHQREFEVTSQDRASQLANPAFDATVWEIFPYLTKGATLFLTPENERLDPLALIKWFASQDITTAFVPTPIANAMLKMESQLSLKWLLTGGDKLNHYPPSDANFTLVNNYGPTENTVVATSGIINSDGKGVAPHIGQPIDNVQVYLLSEALELVPVNIPGELYIGGTQLARGYLNRPELTAERFIEHPEFGRLYKTGDLCRWLPDGNPSTGSGHRIEFIGRTDFQVKIRGFRIELDEIESALRAQKGVREAVVLAREDNALRGDKRLVAYLVGASSTDPDTLRQQLAQRLPEYMVPSAFVELESMPLTPNGKLDRKALPKPNEKSVVRAAVYVAPKTLIETQIATVWANALGVKQVGIYDNFFDLGGHSLLVIKARQELQTVLERDMAVVDLFRYPTINALAEYLDPVNDEQVNADHLIVATAQEQAKKQKRARKRRRQRMQRRSKRN